MPSRSSAIWLKTNASAECPTVAAQVKGICEERKPLGAASTKLSDFGSMRLSLSSIDSKALVSTRCGIAVRSRDLCSAHRPGRNLHGHACRNGRRSSGRECNRQNDDGYSGVVVCCCGYRRPISQDPPRNEEFNILAIP